MLTKIRGALASAGRANGMAAARRGIGRLEQADADAARRLFRLGFLGLPLLPSVNASSLYIYHSSPGRSI